jgi:hypothetical protein
VPTFLELQDEVLSHQFSASQYRPYIQSQLNYGQAYVAAQTDFRELFSSDTISATSGDAEYNLPADFMRVYSLLYVPTSGKPVSLTEVSQGDLDLNAPSSGVPTHYTVQNGEVRLWPTPDTAYTLRLRYYATPTTLTANDDVPEIPGNYHHLLVTYALWHCYERENDYNSAQYHKGRFDEDIMKCRGEVQYDSDDYTQPQQIGDNRRDPMWTL